jgi:predicted metal-binding protein
MPSVDTYVKRARSLGMTKAKIIHPETVVVGHWVRLKCQYGCGGYGGCLTCPPHSPLPEYTQGMLTEYSRGLLVQAKDIDLSRQSGVLLKLRRAVTGIEREMFLDGYYKAFGMASGPCDVCRTCDTGSPCRHPYQARPSMEACGIDVYQTARNNGFTLEVVRSGDSLCSFMSLILIE